MPRLKVAAISFLNTAPLMWDFDHGELRRDYQVDYMLPAACAELLRHDQADIGIIPAAAYAAIPGLVVIPQVAIATRSAVRSILLISKKPLAEVKTIAADTSSRSSVALLKVLCAKKFDIAPDFTAMAPKLNPMLKACDAALIIGDPALLLDTSKYEVYDLGQEWTEWTKLPFVFAFWAARSKALEGRDVQRVAREFIASRDHGLQPENLERICREWNVRLKLPEVEIREYLTQNISYELDVEAQRGLALFYRYAAELGVLPPAEPTYI